MKNKIRCTRVQGCWIAFGLLASFVHAEPAKPDAPASSISTTVDDMDNKDWKEYDNHIVLVHLRINSAWTLMEFKETKQTGSVGLTLSRTPLVTFNVTRDALGGAFEDWVSSPSLSSIYPSGFKKSQTVFAGRKAILVRGAAKDGRQEETYFSSQGGFINQVTFAAPPDAWERSQALFAPLQHSFRWLSK